MISVVVLCLVQRSFGSKGSTGIASRPSARRLRHWISMDNHDYRCNEFETF